MLDPDGSLLLEAEHGVDLPVDDIWEKRVEVLHQSDLAEHSKSADAGADADADPEKREHALKRLNDLFESGVVRVRSVPRCPPGRALHARTTTNPCVAAIRVIALPLLR